MTNVELAARVAELETKVNNVIMLSLSEGAAHHSASAECDREAAKANKLITLHEQRKLDDYDLSRAREANRDAIYNEHLHQWTKHVANVEAHFALHDRINATTSMIHGAGVAALVFIALWLVLHG